MPNFTRAYLERFGPGALGAKSDNSLEKIYGVSSIGAPLDSRVLIGLFDAVRFPGIVACHRCKRSRRVGELKPCLINDESRIHFRLKM